MIATRFAVGAAWLLLSAKAPGNSGTMCDKRTIVNLQATELYRNFGSMLGGCYSGRLWLNRYVQRYMVQERWYAQARGKLLLTTDSLNAAVHSTEDST